MELVKGVSITEYADKNSLSMRERLELFVTVCQAVQHAHQKGIIHRDIKPSNVLVTLHDGRPVPKVIDFGIAKATSHRLTEKTVFTEFRQIVGTPQYMSPEQAEMSGLDVDTRCDIYSLGVLLYELITGTTPFEAERLQTAGYVEMQRIIREEDPPPPSQRVSTRHEQLETIARHRRTEPRGLPAMCQGDLDWIVMKALEKDRTRRYATAGELAADVERHLDDEPVVASPPSLTYLLRKFARRNRTTVTAAAFVACALFIGLALATAGFVRASHEAAHSRAIATFLEEIIAAVDPAEANSRQVDVERVVERARALFGKDHVTVAAALDSLAMRLQHAGDLAGAERLYRESERIWRKNGDKSPSLALTLGHLGALLRLTGDDAAAEAALRESLKIAARLPASAQLAFCDSRAELATLLQRRGRLDEAEALVREALRIRRQAPSQQFQIAKTLELLTEVLVSAGRIDEAEQAFGEAIDEYRPLIPANSPTAAFNNFAYGHWLRQHGRAEKAEPFLREAVRIYRGLENPPRDYYLGALDGMFQLLRWRDDAVDEAIAVFHECMHNMAQLVGHDHASLGPHFLGYAQLLGESNRPAQAIPLLIDGMRIYRKSKGADWNAAPTLGLLAKDIRRVVLRPGRPEAEYEAARDGVRALLNAEPESRRNHSLYGMVEYRLSSFDRAIAELGPTDDAGSDVEYAVERLAFLTMACVRSGDSSAARDSLARLRDRASTNEGQFDKESRALMAECETLVNEFEKTN
jgi:tetratricopeptide (TPR) repeat protein